MSLRVSNVIVVAALASLFAGCGQSDPNPGGSAGSAGKASAGAPGAAGAGTAGAGLAGSSAAGSGAGGAGGSGVAGAGAGGAGGGGAGAGSAGSPGTAGGGSTIPGTFADAVKPVVGGGGGIQSCSAAPCHGKGGAQPPGNGLILPTDDDAVLYTSLTTYVSKGCGNIPLVKKGDPTGSALIKILKGECPSPTARMPLDCVPADGTCIPDEYIAAIAQWITNGAPRQ